MSIRRMWIPAVVGLAVTWGTLFAQQTDQQRRQELPGQQQLQQQQQRMQQQSQRNEAQREARGGKLMLNKADRLIGAHVVDRKGEELGEVHDLAIDKSTGHVAYAVVEFTEVEGVEGNKLHPVPLKALEFQQVRGLEQEQERGESALDRLEAGREEGTWFAEPPRGQAPKLVLEIPKERLRNAPSFNEDSWPNLADRGYGQKVHQFYGVDPYWQGGERTAMRQGQQPGQTGQMRQQGERDQQARAQEGQRGQILRVDEHLIGGSVTRNDENIGEVNNLLIDHQRSKVAFVIVELDEVEGDRNMAALPFNQLDCRMDEQDEVTILTRADINQMKGTLFSQDNWPDLSNRQFATNIYRQFNEQPYWETERTAEDVLGFRE